MSASPIDVVTITINQKRHVIRSGQLPTVHTTLLEYLRYTANHKGTKAGCNEGGCGACTVMLTVPAGSTFTSRGFGSAPAHRTINACTTPLLTLDGCSITTIEGIGDAAHPHPVQERIAGLHATQCGFCTPGMVVSLYTLLKNDDAPSAEACESVFNGHLCRCTGYRPLLDAAKSFAVDLEDVVKHKAAAQRAAAASGSGGRSGAVSPPTAALPGCSDDDWPGLSLPSAAAAARRTTTTTLDKAQQIAQAVPAVGRTTAGAAAVAGGAAAATRGSNVGLGGSGVLLDSGALSAPLASPLAGAGQRLVTVSDAAGNLWAAPSSLALLHETLATYPRARMVAGAATFQRSAHASAAAVSAVSAAGLAASSNSAAASFDGAAAIAGGLECIVWTGGIRELRALRFDDATSSLTIGAAVTFGEVAHCLRTLLRGHAIKGKPAALRESLLQLESAVLSVGSTQSRNMTTVVGHTLARPVGDLVPLLAALHAEVRIINQKTGAMPRVALIRDFCAPAGCLMHNDVVTELFIPSLGERVAVCCKAALRKENSTGTLVMAMSTKVVPKDADVVVDDVLLFSAGASHFLMPMTEAAAALSCVSLKADFVPALRCASDFVLTTMRNELHLPAEGRHGYRIAVARGLVFRLFARLQQVFTYPDPSGDHSLLGPTTGASGTYSREERRASYMVAPPVSTSQRPLGTPPTTGSALNLSTSTTLQPTNISVAAATAAAAAAAAVTPSAPPLYTRPVTTAMQTWEAVGGNIHRGPDHKVDPQAKRAPVGEPIPVLSALQQATGEAQYVDDIPTPAGCLFAALVKSTVPKGSISTIDARPALAVPGVVGYFDYNDLPVKPEPGGKSEKVFAQSTVACVGDVIGLVVAVDQRTADAAAALVNVTYGTSKVAPVFTIEEAIAAKRFYEFGKKVVDGDPDAVFADRKGTNTKVLRGVVSQGGQEHFYLEPHALLVTPGDGGTIDVHSMTQCVMKSQKLVATTLGVPMSKVNVRVKRIGGAFGGKEVRTTYVSAALAVAATKLKRPVRWLVRRDEDMSITGGSHPFRIEWAVAYNPVAKRIVAIDCKLYANGGCKDDVTAEVVTRAIMHVCNAYKIPNVRAQGFCCETNVQSHTAFRGFGAPQAMLAMEVILEAVAMEAQLPVESLQRSHLLHQGDRTHFGQLVPHCKLGEMWTHLMTSSSYAQRVAAVTAFNLTSRWVKRGIAVVPTCYGINFPVRHLNQGSAYVAVYVDGSVVVHHGAVEMGQGIHTKVAQVTAQALGVPVSAVTVADTSSQAIPNTPPTAASMGSDLACMAVLDACEQIKRRLEPFLGAAGATADASSANRNAAFLAACAAAWRQRIPLNAEGFYKTESGAQYDWKATPPNGDNSARGTAYSYFVFGVAASEVEVDVLTGAFRVLRADLLMDCGDSLNPAVDIGQVEGSFVQGLGWLTMEDLIYGDKAHPGIAPGTLFNASPHTYKIPAASDVPIDFRVELLSGAPNPFAVHASKAVGEPPYFLAASVFFAIKRAVYAARSEEGLTDFLPLDSPLTAERIRMACRDDFTLGTFSGYVAPGSV